MEPESLLVVAAAESCAKGASGEEARGDEARRGEGHEEGHDVCWVCVEGDGSLACVGVARVYFVSPLVSYRRPIRCVITRRPFRWGRHGT